MKWFVLILLGTIILGCANGKTSTDAFFEKLDIALPQKAKEEIKKCKDIKCLNLFAWENAHKTLKEFDSLPSEVTSLLDSYGLTNLYSKQLALLIAYQKRLNRQKVSFLEIKDEISQFDELNEVKYLHKIKRDIQFKSNLARKIYAKFSVGDTMNLLFPLEKNGNKESVYFYEIYNKDNFKDTLFLKCVLEKKEFEKITGFDFVHDEYYFYVKILEVKNKEINLVDKDYAKGNITRLSLYDYGRPID